MHNELEAVGVCKQEVLGDRSDEAIEEVVGGQVPHLSAPPCKDFSARRPVVLLKTSLGPFSGFMRITRGTVVS